MKILLAMGGAGMVVVVVALAQPRVSNWATFGGDPQRSGWERTDSRLTPETAPKIQLLWKMQVDGAPVTAPLILGNLISYRGFKELALVATNSDVLYAIDADLGKVFWTKHLEYASREPKLTGTSATCPGGLTATPAMPVPAPRGAPGGRGAAPAAGRGPAAPAAPPAPAARGRAATGKGRGAAARGRAASRAPAASRGPAAPAAPPAPPRGPFAAIGTSSVYVISGDGRLHRINTSTGDDFTQPIGVIPANATASNLNLDGNVLYTVTSHQCDDSTDAVWAVDLLPETLKPVSFTLTDGSAGAGAPVIGSDGTVYVQTPHELLALNPKDLQLKHSFSLNGNDALAPLVIANGKQDWIAAAGADHRLHLLDSASLTPLAESEPLDSDITGALASWQDADETRWILAPDRRAIVAFKLADAGGKPALARAWTSPDLAIPEGPVVAGGVVFALATGSPRATLYALDGATGRQLYSSGSQATASASAPGGLTVANGRVYFTTVDGSVYCFGLYLEH